MVPKVILFNAISLDGRTTGFPLDVEHFYEVASRWGEDASLVGCDTFLTIPVDVPEDSGSPEPFCTPAADDERPILVVPDSRGRLKMWHYLRGQSHWKDFVSICTDRTPAEHVDYLNHKGVKTITAGADHADYRQVLQQLSDRFGVTTVRVDSGGVLNGLLLRAGLADELHLLMYPWLVGRNSEDEFFCDPGPQSDQGIAFQFIESQIQSNGMVLLSYAVTR